MIKGSTDMEINYDRLLEQVKDGLKPSDTVRNTIRRQLLSRQFETDPYTLIHILGKANDIESLPLIRNYMDFDTGDADSDDMVRRIALQVIGRMWALPEAFDLALTKAFHDPSPYVRAVAATIIGFLGSRYPQFQSRSAAALLDGLSKRNELGDYTWKSFYEGLLELLQVPLAEWPSTSAPLKEEAIRTDLVAKAKALALERSSAS
jgi:hypothetical protein